MKNRYLMGYHTGDFWSKEGLTYHTVIGYGEHAKCASLDFNRTHPGLTITWTQEMPYFHQRLWPWMVSFREVIHG